MNQLVCFLEEPSAKEMLSAILPQILPPEIGVRFIVFDGKQDLEKQIVRKLTHWRSPGAKFLVMRDKDSGDCRDIKSNLIKKIDVAGKRTDALVRIACHELESFYLGDLEAVEKGLRVKGISRFQQTAKYRDPDTLANPVEELQKITKDGYQKVAGSREISLHMNLQGNNRSHSFNVLIDGIRKLVGD